MLTWLVIMYQGLLVMRTVYLGLLFVGSMASSESFTDLPRAQQTVEILVTEHGFERALVEQWMAEGNYRQASVNNLAAPAETQRSYDQYKPMFVSPAMISNGRQFAEDYRFYLDRAEELYGVPAEIITAIMGIETRYGASTGRHRTFDALGTLAVTEGRRADYFQREWINYLLIMRDQGMDPLKTMGSYAGAMGYPQFMPSSYIAYAVDHDGDGTIDIWNNPYDAIGSIGNYLKENGWRRGGPIFEGAMVSGEYQQVKLNSLDRDRTFKEVREAGWQTQTMVAPDDWVFPVRLDDDTGQRYWLGFRNFWVVSRYNRSIAYTMAVVQLAEAIKE